MFKISVGQRESERLKYFFEKYWELCGWVESTQKLVYDVSPLLKGLFVELTLFLE